MSNKKKQPDLSKLKQRIKSPEDEPGEKAAPPVPEGPSIKPDTMRQIASYARDVEKARAEEAIEEQEVARVELTDVNEEAAINYTEDNTFYRQTPSDNPNVRKAIEDHCSEMDFADLIITGRVSQEVPILPGKLECEYQSLLASENFWIEREAEKQGTSDWALRSWMGYARLALSLVAINGKSIGSLGSAPKKGEIDRAAFEDKFQKIMNMGEKPIEYLLVNLSWFNDRVDRLSESDFEQLKNG